MPRRRQRRKRRWYDNDRGPRCVTGKITYPDRAAAEQAVEDVADRARRTGQRVPRRAYPCEDGCGGWHLTALSGRAFERAKQLRSENYQEGT